MNFTITSQNKKDHLFIESKGNIESVDLLLTHSHKIYEEISKYDHQKILLYEPEMQLPLDLVPYFNLVQNYIDIFPPEIRELTIAVVFSEKYQEVASTWETLCQSRGLQYFAFTSLQDALDCLLHDENE